jgi:hypothetical protein
VIPLLLPHFQEALGEEPTSSRLPAGSYTRSCPAPSDALYQPLERRGHPVGQEQAGKERDQGGQMPSPSTARRMRESGGLDVEERWMM